MERSSYPNRLPDYFYKGHYRVFVPGEKRLTHRGIGRICLTRKAALVWVCQGADGNMGSEVQEIS